jgi:molybdopterin/thiamine biosynthesis adenylyltransferase/rhodanese-related sulfurtransferase
MALTYQQLVALAKQQITEVTSADIAEGSALLIDVREPEEHRLGTIPGSVLVPRGVVERNLPALVPDPSTELVLFCAVGNRSALAALDVQRMGYRRVASLAGGFEAWRLQGRPTVVPAGEGLERYARHLVLPGIGEEGQKRLAASRVAVVGAGGLGSPAALYLAAAGVGAIGIVDDDAVGLADLQRQVLHETETVGVPKVDSAASALRRLNPEVDVVRHGVRLTAANALEVLGGYDVVVDASDNFPTRYLVNDAAIHLRVPISYGAVFRWEGQATILTPGSGPCFRCLFPAPPVAPLDCAEAGVLGALPGVIGSLQAAETIKFLVGAGDSLEGRLAVYDALAGEWTTLRFSRDPACPACSGEPPVLVDYDEECRPYTG